MTTRPEQAPLIAMSGTPRWPPTTLATPFWYHGRENTADLPPPVARAFGPGLPKKTSFSEVL